uniref:C1, subunit of the circadian RNA-binding protein CHLAMY1 n=1 Tax=Yamagishiella unicocca TaxID=51707 RepID=A0A2Z5X880_9CHLO|nr:C1, subunit of the circadian RNA-binding protein CHLAMY1 [Yamagishiella unicocca]
MSDDQVPGVEVTELNLAGGVDGEEEQPRSVGNAEGSPAAEALRGSAEPPDGSKPNSAVTEAILDAGRNRALELASLFAAQAGQIPGAQSESSKRKLEDTGNTDAPDLKRLAVDGLGMKMPIADVSSVLPSSSSLLFSDGATATETIMCPSDKVGRVIGRAGATIRDLEASTSTRIQVDHKAPGEKPVTISGKRDDVERAKRTVLDLISGTGDTVPVTGEVQKMLECPQGIVGRVIGRGGETIRTLQQASGAHILVNQDFPDGIPRQITITGTQDSVDRAINMVSELISGDHANTQAVIQRFGVGSTEVMECPKAMVGRIIGKGGETIKDLQKRFSVSIQIDQNGTPCKVTITGPGQMIAAARRAIDDLVRSTNTPIVGGPRPGPAYNAPFAQPPYPGSVTGGPYGTYNGFGMPPAGYTASGGYPSYSGYAAYPAAVPPYGNYNAFGAPASDPYGNSSSFNHHSYAPAVSVQQNVGTPSQAAAAGTSWQALQDEQGRTYYYNSQTGVSQWEKPTELS